MTTKEISIPVTGMTCASCVRRIEKALARVDGVQDATVNLATERAKVRYDADAVTLDQMKAAVEKAGYGVRELPVEVDGNAVAGLLQEIFALEMTTSPTECVHCGRTGALAKLLAFTHAPGVVLCCPGCEQVMLRIVETPDAIYLDARGTAVLRLERHTS